MDQGDRFNQKNHDLNYDDLVERVIEEINDFSGFDLISGNRFNDLWEEIAYQVQIERSHNFYVYVSYIETICRKIIRYLPDTLVCQLCLLSDSRGKIFITKGDLKLDEEVQKSEIERNRDSVTDKLIEAVWKKAAKYSLMPYALYDLPEDDWVDGIIENSMEMLEDHLEKINCAEKEIFNYDECVELVIIELRKHFLISKKRDKDYWEKYIDIHDAVREVCCIIVEDLPQEKLLSLWRESIAICGSCDEDSEPERFTMEQKVAPLLFKKVVCAAVNDDSAVWGDSEDDVGDEEFELQGWEYVIQVAIDVARLLLSQRNLSASHVVSLGKALYALERLPKVTPEIYCEFGICYPAGDEKNCEKTYIACLISDEEFEITTERRLYDQSNNYECITDQKWRIDIGCYDVKRVGVDNLTELEKEIRKYLQLGAEIKIKDLSGEFDKDGECL